MAKCKDCNFLHKDGHCGGETEEVAKAKLNEMQTAQNNPFGFA